MSNEIENEYLDFEEESDEEYNNKINKELTIYKNNSEKIEYFLGHEIAKLLGYKNTKQSIQLNVKEENKISFKNYNGVKEPKINSSVKLITRNGIKDLLNKRKTLDSDVINILSKVNIDVSKFNNESEVDEDCDEKELLTYTYVSNGLFFEYFVGFQITSLLGYKNAVQTLTNVSKQNKIEFREYPGVQKPKLDPKTILITRDGAVEILIKTRKILTPDVIHILKEFGIDTTNRKCLTKEQQTLSAIANTFKTEKIEDQFKIGSYYLDMYLPEYKIVVECDENGHADRKPYKERERMDYVNKEFDIDDTHWMRYNPDEHDFDLSKVIGRIYNRIILIKKDKMEKELEEFKKQFENEKDNDSWTIYKNRFTSSKENITKTCRKCEKTLDINLFRNSGSSKDGHIYNCINCDKISNKAKNIITTGVKTCFTCKLTKSFSDFSNTTNNIDGKCSYCKECSNQRQKEAKIKKGPRQKYEPSLDITEKCCLFCDDTKPVSEFWKCTREKDGYNPNCVDCAKKLRKTYNNKTIV